MRFEIFDHARPDLTTEEAVRAVGEIYGITGRATPLSGERDRSFRIDGAGERYVLKFGNAADLPGALAAQSAAMLYARQADASLPIPRVIPTREGQLTGRHREHATQLIEFVDGETPPSASSPGLHRAIGRMAGLLSRALRGFGDPRLERPFPWDLTRLTELAPLLSHVTEPRREAIGVVVDHFADEVAPILDTLPRQALHGDLNRDNLLVDPLDGETITGVFDFGDMYLGPRVCDLAVAATYQSFGPGPVSAIPQMAAAFHAADGLEPAEIDILPDLVAARCAQSLLMSARQVSTHPENASYTGGDVDDMWRTLAAVTSQRAEIDRRLRNACGLRTRPKSSLAEAIRRRRATLGPALTLSYDEPVRLSFADGVWLYDTEGNRLLDAYNNVPHVGHAHPAVTAALAAQSKTLTTNTRYLVDSVVEYAERLAGLLPDPLSTVMFVNSGSEANDLALQIARTVTGRRGLVTTDHAYHGTTLATIAMSPEEHATGESWAVRVRGAEALALDDPVSRLRDDLQEASRSLDVEGHGPAMVIFDTIFSSEGIFPLPSGYLHQAREWANEKGALLVADEVQAGFGRLGPGFWGFSSDDVVPDIVTLGKPLGNGHPMGAVVTTSAIAAEFASHAHFFSTFAGSPVAAAVGMAVLDVIEDEELPERAALVGDDIRQKIGGLASPLITEIRGRGLFIGVEMTDGSIARRVTEDMRSRRVLIGVTGPRGNVLKIRPPLAFTERHALLLVEALAASLDSVI